MSEDLSTSEVCLTRESSPLYSSRPQAYTLSNKKLMRYAMASKRKPERLEMVLTQVLASVLTLVTVVPLFAFLDFTAQTSELAVAIIVFGAWLLIITMVAPVWQKRRYGQGPEQAP